MLERDIREQWLEIMDDPESFGYRKARGRLRKTRRNDGRDTFCALGVLADIHPDLQWQRHEHERSEHAVWTVIDKGANDENHRHGTMLPASFIARYRLARSALDAIARENDRSGGFDQAAEVARRWL